MLLSRQGEELNVRGNNQMDIPVLTWLKDAAEQKILEWLWPSSNFSKIQNGIRHCRVKDTGDWLIQDLEILDWYRCGGLIWIHGVGEYLFQIYPKTDNNNE